MNEQEKWEKRIREEVNAFTGGVEQRHTDSLIEVIRSQRAQARKDENTQWETAIGYACEPETYQRIKDAYAALQRSETKSNQ